jgi:cytochrome P450 / NADPH-cytochrome P450 reductase
MYSHCTAVIFLFQIVVSTTGPSPLPLDKEISVLEVLSGYVELSQPATTRDIKKLVELSEGGATSKLEGLLSNYQELVLEKRISPAHP